MSYGDSAFILDPLMKVSYYNNTLVIHSEKVKSNYFSGGLLEASLLDNIQALATQSLSQNLQSAMLKCKNPPHSHPLV